MSQEPSRSLLKARDFPSGETAGWMLLECLAVRRASVAPWTDLETRLKRGEKRKVEK